MADFKTKLKAAIDEAPTSDVAAQLQSIFEAQSVNKPGGDDDGSGGGPHTPPPPPPPGG